MYQLKQYQDAMIDAVESIQPNLFITFVFNRPITELAAAHAVEEFFRRVERKAHGKRWVDFPREMRLKAFAFPEHPDSNAHSHAALAGSDRVLTTIDKSGEEIWRALTKTGHLDCQAPRRNQAIARYITKRIRSPRSYAHFVVYGPTAPE